MNDLAEMSRHTKFQLYFWYPVARAFAHVMLFLLGPVRVRGKYRIPRTGPVLVLSNHLSDIDPIVVQHACPRPLHFMAKSELFVMPVVGRLIRAFGSIPVRRGAPDRPALKQCATLLDAGEAVGVFPEGKLSEDGYLQELKGGVALIMRLAPGVPVICCGLSRTNKIIPCGSLIPRPAWGYVDVTWGEPRIFDKSVTTEDILAWVTAQFLSLSSNES